MSPVRALRGATTVEEDSVVAITERVEELLGAMMAKNHLDEPDLISIIFTSTADLVAMFPATAARNIGFGAVPLLCAQEIPVPGSMRQCVRVLMHVETEAQRDDIHHVYLHAAQGLRDDLPS